MPSGATSRLRERCFVDVGFEDAEVPLGLGPLPLLFFHPMCWKIKAFSN